MLEAIFVLFICGATPQGEQCQVRVVVPEKVMCEQQKAQIIAEFGKPPEGVSLKCVKFSR